MWRDEFIGNYSSGSPSGLLPIPDINKRESFGIKKPKTKNPTNTSKNGTKDSFFGIIRYAENTTTRKRNVYILFLFTFLEYPRNIVPIIIQNTRVTISFSFLMNRVRFFSHKSDKEEIFLFLFL